MYYMSLFDTARFSKKSAKKDNKEQIESIVYTYGDSFAVVFARIKQYMDQSGRNRVDLGKVFSMLSIGTKPSQMAVH
jgi:hypothetical protein